MAASANAPTAGPSAMPATAALPVAPEVIIAASAAPAAAAAAAARGEDARAVRMEAQRPEKGRSREAPTMEEVLVMFFSQHDPYRRGVLAGLAAPRGCDMRGAMQSSLHSGRAGWTECRPCWSSSGTSQRARARSAPLVRHAPARLIIL